MTDLQAEIGSMPLAVSEPIVPGEVDVRLDTFLAFEESSDVLQFRFQYDGLLMWPFIRFSIMAHALERRTGFQFPMSSSLTAREALRYAQLSLRHSPLKIGRRFDIVVIGSTSGLVIKEGEKWLGRINDDFAKVYEDRTLVMDDSTRRRYRLPRAVRHHACHDWLRLRGALLGRVFGRASKRDCLEIEGLIGFLRRRFPADLDDGLLRSLSQRLRTLSERWPFLHTSYRTFFERVRPKMIFMEGGSYGEDSHIFKWAKDAEIRTGEFQHGIIHPHHAAYNYGPAILQSPAYRPHLPDHLLTYGRFWARRLRMPSEVVAIGNPYLSRRASAGPRSTAGTGPRRVLIVSDTTLPTYYAELAMELSRRLGRDWEILLKPHPMEAPFVRERFGRLAGVPGIGLAAAEEDLYDYFARCECVVGMCSTSLFEALAFGKRVFVREHFIADWGVPAALAPRFRDACELAELIRSAPGSGPSHATSLEEIWQPGWRENYAAFIDKHVPGTHPGEEP
jgi:hypothetical protein